MAMHALINLNVNENNEMMGKFNLAAMHHCGSLRYPAVQNRKEFQNGESVETDKLEKQCGNG
jgi:hypothetical protein